jgi:hypothetical protein
MNVVDCHELVELITLYGRESYHCGIKLLNDPSNHDESYRKCLDLYRQIIRTIYSHKDKPNETLPL